MMRINTITADNAAAMRALIASLSTRHSGTRTVRRQLAFTRRGPRPQFCRMSESTRRVPPRSRPAPGRDRDAPGLLRIAEPQVQLTERTARREAVGLDGSTSSRCLNARSRQRVRAYASASMMRAAVFRPSSATACRAARSRASCTVRQLALGERDHVPAVPRKGTWPSTVPRQTAVRCPSTPSVRNASGYPLAGHGLAARLDERGSASESLPREGHGAHRLRSHATTLLSVVARPLPSRARPCNAHDLFHRRDEDLPVSVRPVRPPAMIASTVSETSSSGTRTRSAPWEGIDQYSAPIELGVALLPPEALHLVHGEALHPHGGQPILTSST